MRDRGRSSSAKSSAVSELLTREEGIREALGHLASIVDTSDDAIVSKDLDGTVRTWNRAAERMFGFSAAEMVGSSIMRIIPPELHDEERRILATIAGGGFVDHYETQRLRKDGSRVSVSLTISAIKDEDGNVIGASKIARDVTRRGEAERAQSVLASIIESSDDAIMSKDLNGIITSWNPAAERLYGYSSGEIVGQSVLRIIPPHLHSDEARILDSVRAGIPIEHYETVRVRKDGTLVDVSLTVSPIRDRHGRVIGASKIARDTTAQRRGDRARGILAAIVQSSDDAIISKDLDGVITSWNPAAQRMYGYREDEMVGQPVRKIIPEELQPEEDHILASIRAGRALEHFETQRLRKDGTRVEVSLTVSPVRNDSGTIIGASKIARDITAQRDAERKKDQFLAILAHELRNPLAPVRNALAIIRMAGLPEEKRESVLAMAERQMAHLTRLLDDLLDVSRLSTGHVELKKERVDFASIARQSAESARPTLEARKHAFRVVVPEEQLWINGDTVRIAQIINNLLTNAAKYTDPGGEVDFTVRREGDAVVARVKDNGIGFDKKTKGQLFALFSQAEEAVSRAAGGLGIGLALVREFAERHGGTVDAKSDGPMKGSEFTLRLPLATVKA